MRLLVISKTPEFSAEGDVVPGQCEPYTTGWRLRLVSGGETEVLLAGTYYELRRVQRRCIGKPVEDIRRLVAESKEAMETSSHRQVAGDADEATQILGMEDVRRAMQEMEAVVQAGQAGSYSDWFVFEDRAGVRVAMVRDSAQAVAADEIGRILLAAMTSTSGGMVVDLSGCTAGGKGYARVFRDLSERARGESRFLGYVGPNDELMKSADELGFTGSLHVYSELDAALEAATEAARLDLD